MRKTTAAIVAILATYSRGTVERIDELTTLQALDIDRLDLPMIVLDIEDALDIHICYENRIEGATTVAVLIACVDAAIEAMALRRRIRSSTPRIKRSWVSTTAAV